jgi:hypothetical protein
MAKKSKTPPPPRPVQAPRARTDSSDRRTRLLLYGFAAAGLVALAAVLAVAFLGGGDDGGDVGSTKDLAALMTAAGCDYKDVKSPAPPGGQQHVDSLSARIKWNTFPPSNGQHYGSWGVWGFYTDPVNPRLVVHNEEHGGVVLWWGPKTPQAEIDRLNALYSDDPLSMFGTPIAGLGRKVAISAWTGDPAKYQRNGDFGEGHVAVCPKFDDATKDAFVAFRDKFRGNGPEGIPEDQNQPGSGPG